MYQNDCIDRESFVCAARRPCETETRLEYKPLAMAYVPWHKFEKLYDENTALNRGTVFPSLDLPFCAAEVFDYGV